MTNLSENGQDDRRNVDDDDNDDDEQHVAEELAYFAGVGGDDVEKHVDGDDRAAVHIEEHALKSGEEEEDDHPQRSLSDLRRDGHEQHVDAERKDDVG